MGGIERGVREVSGGGKEEEGERENERETEREQRGIERMI